MPKTCLIVPTYSEKSWETISTLLETVNVQTIQSIDIIVVNNNSLPLCLSTELNKWQVFIINGKKNLGSAGGFYLGMRFAYEKWYNYYILWDDDAKLVSDDVLEVLVSDSMSHPGTVFRPFWKEKSQNWSKVAPSISCYWCLSHEIIAHCWFYHPIFFYGWEDGAYGDMLAHHRYSIMESDKFIAHPVKPWLTCSRGSSGLSSFRFNSILQHSWRIVYMPLLTKLRSSILIFWYIGTLFFWAIFFTKYFRIQMLFNLRNLICYFPPILTSRMNDFLYPVYHNAMYDDIYVTREVDSTDYTENWKLINGTNASRWIVLDNWFLFSKYTFLMVLKKMLDSYMTVSLMHEAYDNESSILKVKHIIAYKNSIHKYAMFLLYLLSLPSIAFISLILAIILIIKYIILIGIINDFIRRNIDIINPL